MHTKIVTTPSSLVFHSLDDAALVDVRTAGAVLHLSRSSVLRLFASGDLERIKIGQAARIRVGDIRRLIGGGK